MNVDIEDVDSEDEYEENDLLDGDEEDDMDWCNADYSAERRRKAVLLFFLADCDKKSNIKKRKSCRRITVEDRMAPWLFVETWPEALFERQFRMDRKYFFKLLKRMIDTYEGPFDTGEKNYKFSCKQGNNSHGYHVPLQIKLCITLRMLAGASYLDMIWYGVDLGYVETIFIKCLHLIEDALPDDFIFNCNADTKFDEMANEWTQIMTKRKGFSLMRGTILAGDGLVVKIRDPTVEDRKGLEVAAFRNRKGYFGVIVQAFCDAFCMIRYFEVAWPGATPDITCYKQTLLRRMWRDGIIPSCYHMVLDEAYSSVGGDNHLTPFSKAQLLVRLLVSRFRGGSFFGRVSGRFFWSKTAVKS
jgi:hypothetical protein